MANKTKKAQKRRQKRALKSTRRRKVNKGKVRSPREIGHMASASKLVGGPLLSEEDSVFWLAHAINFLSSNYDEGEWAPLFPEVYLGKLDTTTITARLFSVAEKDGPDMSGRERAILAYAMQGAYAHYAFMKKAEQTLQAAGVEDAHEAARQPRQPLVWQMFHEEVLVIALRRAGEVL